MMRVGEVTLSPHVPLAKNIHIATNKDKLLLVLYSSKTHGLWSRPQKIKITSNKEEKTGSYLHRNFCPFALLRNYLKVHGNYREEKEPFFVFSDDHTVKSQQISSLLKNILKNLGIDEFLLHAWILYR